MKITCLLLSHVRPIHLHVAVRSVLAQSHEDFQLLLIDSGTLRDIGHFEEPLFADPRIEVVVPRPCPEGLWAPSWSLNECIQLVRGDLVLQCCDDDFYYSHAFETFHRAMTGNPDWQACYAEVQRNNQPTLRALEVCGLDSPYRMDRRVDGMQFCFRRQLFDRMDNKRPWHEEMEHRDHADGLFMNQICDSHCYVHPVPVIVGCKT